MLLLRLLKNKNNTCWIWIYAQLWMDKKTNSTYITGMKIRYFSCQNDLIVLNVIYTHLVSWEFLKLIKIDSHCKLVGKDSSKIEQKNLDKLVWTRLSKLIILYCLVVGAFISRRSNFLQIMHYKCLRSNCTHNKAPIILVT